MTRSISTYLNAILPPILWAGMIFLFSHQSILPGFSLSVLDFLFKKSAHVFVFGVLYLLIWRAGFLIKFNAKKLDSSLMPSYKNWWLPLAIVIIYAVSDELHQSLVSGRSASLRDVGFDTLGASLMMLKIYHYI